MLRVFFGAPDIYCSKNVVVCWDGPLSGFELTWIFNCSCFDSFRWYQSQVSCPSRTPWAF